MRLLFLRRMTDARRHRPRAKRALPWRGVLAAALAAIFFNAPVQASDEENHRTQAVDIDAGDLSQALKTFSEQTGVSVLFRHGVASAKKAPALYGVMTPREAIAAMLAETQLTFREINPRAFVVFSEMPSVDLAETPAPYVELIPEDSPRIDEIVVAASYRAPDLYANVRVDYALDEEVLSLSGAQNVSEPILELPTTLASTTSSNTQLFISANGLNLADLRGLQPRRSLVLVDGARFVRTSGGNGGIYGVDLNSIPTAFIDRVEIINQGAGAALGTDAVGGAINIVLRDHIDGVSITADGGVSERGDAEEYSLSAFAGATFAAGRGKISGGVAYASDPDLFFSDRDYLAEPFGFGLDGRKSPPGVGVFAPGFGGSVFTPAGAVAGAVAENGEVTHFLDLFDQFVLTPDSFEPYEGRLDQLFNWVEGFSALPDIDRLHARGKIDFELTPNIIADGSFFFADVETHTQLSPAPIVNFRGFSTATGDAIVVPADHPDAPAGLRAAIENEIGAPIQSFLINRRFAEIGPRTRDLDRQTVRAAVGVTATVNNDWALDARYSFGRNRVLDVAGGEPDGARIAIAVDPARCTATPGCQAFNIFAGGSTPESVADFYRLDGRERRITTTEHIVRAAASGPVYEKGDQSAFLSLGAEYRRVALEDRTPEEQSQLLALGDFEAPGSSGAVEYGELFIGTDLPLAGADAPFGSVEFGFDARLTWWTEGGFVANVSGDLSWRPVEGLELYAFALEGGRAPNVVELFSAGLNSASIFFDPCAAPDAATVAVNCQSSGPLGTPSDFVQEDQLVFFRRTGNPNLNEENVHTRHFGAALDIDKFIYLGDDTLRLTADWRLHRVTDAIDGTDGRVLNLCYESEGLSDRFCGLNPATGNLFLQRDSVSGRLDVIEATFLNGGAMRTNGLDATLTYRSDFAWAPLQPSLSVDFLYSYTNKFEIRDLYDGVQADLTGLANFPRHQLFSTASLETDRLKTIWTVRRRGSAMSAPGVRLAESELPAKTYVDAGFQFRPADRLILYAGIENLFDKRLPVVAFAERGFFAEFYDPIGRRYFAGFKAEF